MHFLHYKGKKKRNSLCDENTDLLSYLAIENNPFNKTTAESIIDHFADEKNVFLNIDINLEF